VANGVGALITSLRSPESIVIGAPNASQRTVWASTDVQPGPATTSSPVSRTVNVTFVSATLITLALPTRARTDSPPRSSSDWTVVPTVGAAWAAAGAARSLGGDWAAASLTAARAPKAGTIIRAANVALDRGVRDGRDVNIGCLL
jgi:hypothetical protein